MGKYRKKPVVIDAIQFRDAAKEEGAFPQITDWVRDAISHGVIAIGRDIAKDELYANILTLEGVMRANEGDWIIRGVEGEIYPCADSIFTKTYEPAEQTEQS